MPKENRKRGRRGDKKRKLEESNEENVSLQHKRQKQEGGQQTEDYIALDTEQHHDYGTQEEGEGEGETAAYTGPGERPFYGLLDEEEQEYFRKAGEVLDLDDFPDAQERSDFIESVFREADGKELKLANSQSCSRLFERLLCLATHQQLKKTFEKFGGNFVSLVQHRFASHCCETLFTRAAPVVSTELMKNTAVKNEGEAEKSMAHCFLEVVEELKEHLGWLLTDKFASHPLRVLLLVLSGQPISQQAGKSGLHSKRKEQIEVTGQDHAQLEALMEERAVPSSFKDALESLIATAVAGLDTDQLRSLSAHPLGNPTLQLLLRLELTQFGKQRAKDESSIIRVLIPEEVLSADSPSSSFVVGLMYDTVGSRLLETIIEYAPAKTFKSIYRGIIFPKLETLMKNDTATYVVSKALVRLGKDEVQEAISVLAPLVPSLVERNRLAFIRTLVDHTVYRQADTEPIAKYLSMAYASPSGFNVNGFLNPATAKDDTLPDLPANDENKSATKNTNLKLHASLLAQSLLNSPSPLSPLFLDPLVALAPIHLLKFVKDTYAAHTLVKALTSQYSPIISRRKLVAALYGHIASLATLPYSSHVIDALWNGTRGLTFMRERVAEELVEAEFSLRESHYGRRVWRNWRMDMYKRKRRDWVAYSKSADEDIASATSAATPASGGDTGNEAPFVDFPSDDTAHFTRRHHKHGSSKTSPANGTDASKHHKHGTNGHHHQHQDTITGQAAAGAAAGAGANERAQKHKTALEKARERHAANKARREREMLERAARAEAEQHPTHQESHSPHPYRPDSHQEHDADLRREGRTQQQQQQQRQTQQQEDEAQEGEETLTPMAAEVAAAATDANI